MTIETLDCSLPARRLALPIHKKKKKRHWTVNGTVNQNHPTRTSDNNNDHRNTRLPIACPVAFPTTKTNRRWTFNGAVSKNHTTTITTNRRCCCRPFSGLGPSHPQKQTAAGLSLGLSAKTTHQQQQQAAAGLVNGTVSKNRRRCCTPFSGLDGVLQIPPELRQGALHDEGHDERASERHPRHADVAHEQIELGKVKLPAQEEHFKAAVCHGVRWGLGKGGGRRSHARFRKTATFYSTQRTVRFFFFFVILLFVFSH